MNSVKNIAWVDRDYNKYTLEEISNRYLMNILRFLCRGGGYTDYLDKDKIQTLFDEAEKRGIKHTIDIKDAFDAFETKILGETLNEMWLIDELNI